MNSLYGRYQTLIKNNIPSDRKNLGILIDKHWADLQDHYGTNIYHDFSHISMGLYELEKDLTFLEFREDLEFAYFYHDIIVGCRDAEILSSMFAINVRNSMKLILFPNIIAECIAETKFANLMDHEMKKFRELNVIHDMDLIILGKDWNTFINYDDNIVMEYGTSFDKNKRAEILYGFYENKKIYRTERYLDLYQNQAKSNLKRILKERYGIL